MTVLGRLTFALDRFATFAVGAIVNFSEFLLSLLRNSVIPALNEFLISQNISIPQNISNAEIEIIENAIGNTANITRIILSPIIEYVQIARDLSCLLPPLVLGTDCKKTLLFI